MQRKPRVLRDARPRFRFPRRHGLQCKHLLPRARAHRHPLFIGYYYDQKRRNGYSEMEIVQKREALENVLIPYKLLENRELLLRTGFRYVDVFFKWYNFCGMVAVK